jgi:hypothetical protein
MKLVDATRREDGTYIGGRVVVATNAEIADISLEQYRGNVPGAAGDGPDARFQYNGAPLGLFGYVRASMSSGGFTLNPVYELTMSMRTLCDEVKERSIQVNMSVASGIASRPHPGLLPGNFPGSDNAEWEEHASLAADARLRNSVAELYRSVEENIRLWQAHDLRIAYDGPSLKDALEESFEREARSCAVTYKNSDGKVIALTLGDVILRLNSLGFDPYHCIERRWGAVSAEELASCKDDETKTRWYMAEQRLRNQAEAAHRERPALTLSELDAHAPGSGTDAWPPVHIEALIENMI